MTITYTEIVADGLQEAMIQRNNMDGSISFIPTDPANSDYQAYLATLASESANDSTGNK